MPSPACHNTSPSHGTLEGSTLLCLEERDFVWFCLITHEAPNCSFEWQHLPEYDLYGELLNMSPHPKSISLTSDVSLLISKLLSFMSRWRTPRRQHMFAAWAACRVICLAFSSSSLPPWRLMNWTRSSQGEGHSRTITKWSGQSCQSSSLMISGTLGPLFARMVRAISIGRGFGWSG